MLRNRLQEILNERGLKNARVAQDIPELSRNVLDEIVNNNDTAIPFATVDLLCRYLNIKPADFFEYLPFDVTVSVNTDVDFYCADNFYTEINDGLLPVNENFQIPAFYLNLYIVKQSGTSITGLTKRVFELSAVMEAPLKLLPHPESDLSDNLFQPSQDIDFYIVLGDPLHEVTAIERREFFAFWNETLTPGFREELMNQIQSTISSYIHAHLLTLPGIDWSQCALHITYEFDKKVDPIITSAPRLIEKVNTPDPD